jgi:ABC-2 type transport system permease protein
MVLTRSRTRGELFAGKAGVALGFALVAVALFAASSLAAGRVAVGWQPLVGLSGTELPRATALMGVVEAWGSVVPPVFAFAALAVICSLATRSSAAGIGLPVLIGFAMEISSFVDAPAAARKALISPAFVAWHGLLAEPRYTGPIVQGAVTSAVYLAVCLGAAYAVFRRREVDG